MKLQYKNILIFSLIVVVLSSTLLAQENEEALENNEPEAEEIVVVARKNFCDPHVMERTLGSDYQATIGAVFNPGTKLSGEVKSPNPYFFQAGTKTSQVLNINDEDKTLDFKIGYITCLPKECAEFTKKYPDFSFVQHNPFSFEEDDKISPTRHYFLTIKNIKFDDMFDARGANVKVSCPQNTCSGIIIESFHGRIFYTAIHSGNDVETRLVVHGGNESKMVEGSDEGNFEKCEAPSVISSKKKKSKK